MLADVRGKRRSRTYCPQVVMYQNGPTSTLPSRPMTNPVAGKATAVPMTAAKASVNGNSMSKSIHDHGTSGLPPVERHHKASPSGGAIRRRWKGDQLWSHLSDEGEEWLLIRLASPTNTRTSRSRLLDKPARLLAAVSFSLAFQVLPLGFLSELRTSPPIGETFAHDAL